MAEAVWCDDRALWRRPAAVIAVVLIHIAILWPLIAERSERLLRPDRTFYLVPVPATPRTDAVPIAASKDWMPPALATGPISITPPVVSLAPPVVAPASVPAPTGSCPPLPPDSKDTPAPGCQVLIIPGGLHFDPTGKLVENAPVKMDTQTPAEREKQRKAALAKLQKLFGHDTKPKPGFAGERDRAPEFSPDPTAKLNNFRDQYLSEKSAIVKKMEGEDDDGN